MALPVKLFLVALRVVRAALSKPAPLRPEAATSPTSLVTLSRPSVPLAIAFTGAVFERVSTGFLTSFLAHSPAALAPLMSFCFIVGSGAMTDGFFTLRVTADCGCNFGRMSWPYFPYFPARSMAFGRSRTRGDLCAWPCVFSEYLRCGIAGDFSLDQAGCALCLIPAIRPARAALTAVRPGRAKVA